MFLVVKITIFDVYKAIEMDEQNIIPFTVLFVCFAPQNRHFILFLFSDPKIPATFVESNTTKTAKNKKYSQI